MIQRDLQINNNNYSWPILTLISVSILSFILISYFLRFNHHDNENYVVNNMDASYHVLLTIKALQENPSRVHKFLPIVTLGNPEDKNIKWGATVSDAYGNYYYTSFSPLGFVAPYWYFRITGYELTIKNLAFFNIIIHSIAAFLFAWLISLFMSSFSLSSAFRGILVINFTAFYIFSNESLYSHGIIYWHHSLFQVFWLIQLIALHKVCNLFEVGNDYTNKIKKIGFLLIVAIFLGAMTEWTGYLTALINSGIIFYLAFSCKNNKRELYWLAFGIIISASIAISLFLIHFILVVGADQTLYALGKRFLARSSLHSSPIKLAVGYFFSYGILPLVTMFAIFIVYVYRRAWINEKAIVLLLVASITPLVENLLLMNHAYNYSFDRLKAIVPMMLLISLSAVISGKNIRYLLAIGLLISLISNLYLFKERFREINAGLALEKNSLLISQLPSYSEPCVLYALDTSVRGWVNLSFNRGVFEGVRDKDQLKSIVTNRDSCIGVLLYVKRGFLISNVYEYAKAVIYYPDTDSFQEIQH